MMLHKFTLSVTSFNLNNQKRKRATSLLANIGPILQCIKRTLSSNNNDVTQRPNTIHCYVSENHQEEQECVWSQETRLYTLCYEKSCIRPQYQVRPRENWWSN